jgi:hypothetical protein
MPCRLAAASTRANRSLSKRIVTTTSPAPATLSLSCRRRLLMLPTARIICVDRTMCIRRPCNVNFALDGGSPQKIARAIASMAGLRGKGRGGGGWDPASFASVCQVGGQRGSTTTHSSAPCALMVYEHLTGGLGQPRAEGRAGGERVGRSLSRKVLFCPNTAPTVLTARAPDRHDA